MNENRRRCVLVEVVGMVVPLGTSGQTFKFIWTDLKVCCTTTGNETIGIATGAQCISSNGVCPLCRGPSDALRDAAHKTPRTIYASRTRDAFLRHSRGLFRNPHRASSTQNTTADHSEPSSGLLPKTHSLPTSEPKSDYIKSIVHACTIPLGRYTPRHPCRS